MTYTVQTTIKFDKSCLDEARKWETKMRWNYDNDIASLLFDWAYFRQYDNESYDVEYSILVNNKSKEEQLLEDCPGQLAYRED